MVIGGGVAGVTAAIEVRKLHPAAQVTLIGGESYDFYNRMAIDRLAGEETAIAKLYLMPRDWAESRGITYLRGIDVASFDPLERRVSTNEGETIPYDRLVLAMGAVSAVPPLDGFGMGGTFVLRTIDDAVGIQQHIRGRRALRACAWRRPARPGSRAQHERTGSARHGARSGGMAASPPA